MLRRSYQERINVQIVEYDWCGHMGSRLDRVKRVIPPRIRAYDSRDGFCGIIRQDGNFLVGRDVAPCPHALLQDKSKV